MNMYSLDVVIREQIKGGFKLKVSEPELGIYMDGFRATTSDKSEKGWWIQPPSYFKGKWWQAPEFDKRKQLWQEIEKACIDVVSEATRDSMHGHSQPTTIASHPLNEESINEEFFDNGQDYGYRPAPRRYHE